MPAPPPRSVRIIGGRWKRTPLRVVDADGLRPTPDRVRETLFNWIGTRIDGAQVLDLFAGTGALGFEAASRGAARVSCVETNRAALEALRANARKLDRGNIIEIVAGDAFLSVERFARQQRHFDLIFLDPPFGRGLAARALEAAVPCMADDALVYLESEAAAESALLDTLGLRLRRSDTAGQVHYHLLESS